MDPENYFTTKYKHQNNKTQTKQDKTKVRNEIKICFQNRFCIFLSKKYFNVHTESKIMKKR